MSQSAYQSTIEDLPDVTSSTNNTISKEIFCLGLFINIAASGPCRMFVTDFTNNKLISNSYIDSYFIDEFEIPTEQIFQIDLYKEKLKSLIDEYEAKFDEVLFDPGAAPPFRISDKICIVNVSVMLKKFNNVLEGRARSIRLVNEADMANEKLQKLFTNLTQLPNSFFIENIARAKQVIPNTFYSRILDKTSNINTKPAASSTSESVINDSQPRQTYVKTEETTEAFIPDTLFPDDYQNNLDRLPEVRNSQPLARNESQSQNQKQVNNNQNESQNLYQSEGITSQKYYSLKQLNDNYTTDVDNEIYRVKGKIVGYSPSDWSYICIKKYENKMNKISLSDPSIRDLELTICDQVAISNLEEILLDSDNSITVFLDKEQIIQALNLNAIESIYTSISELNDKSFTDNVVEFELYKKFINVNATNKFLVWTVRNISFNNIMN